MKKNLLLSVVAIIVSGDAVAEEIEHKGTVEGGITFENGNTQSENYRGSLTYTSTMGIYENIFKADGDNTSQNNVRTGEEYNVSDQFKVSYSELDYGFIEVDWNKDRYAGIDYRTSQVVGLGHYFVKEENLNVLGEIAVGARQTEYYANNIEDESTAIGRISGDIDWKINEFVSFDHRTDYTIGDDNNVTEAVTGLKAFLNSKLYVRVSHELEHNSETPSIAVKNTDTKTLFTVGYEF